MSIFYKGVSTGSYWHEHDAQLNGMTPKAPHTPITKDRVLQHIARAVLDSPFMSLTQSFGVAHHYALYFSRAVTNASKPAYVYEIEISEPLPEGLTLVDPLRAIAGDVPEPPIDVPYGHDGDSEFLLGVISPKRMRRFLEKPIKQPPPGTGTPRAANLSLALETLVRALRDAEILACGTIPSDSIVSRHAVWLEQR
jgi:hypothetical protein